VPAGDGEHQGGHAVLAPRVNVRAPVEPFENRSVVASLGCNEPIRVHQILVKG
jgi:hypothetical protein